MIKLLKPCLVFTSAILLTGCNTSEVFKHFSEFFNASSEEKTGEIHEPEIIDPLEEKIKKQSEKYEKRITTYDPKRYFIPASKPAASDIDTKCESGVGGTIRKLNAGIFDQKLYRLDAEFFIDKLQGDVLYAPYSLVTTVAGDVLYETEIDSFDRQLNTTRSIKITQIPQKIISSYGYFTNSNNAVMMETRSYPVAYLTSMNDYSVQLGMFNDACHKSIGQREYEWREIDISGKAYDTLTSAISEQFVRVNQMGMFTSSNNFYSYFSQSFGNYLNQNLKFKKGLAAAGRFPKGSKIYVPASIKTLDETLTVMEDPELIVTSSIEDLIASYNQYAKNKNLGKITFKKHELKNQIVFYTPWNETKEREAFEFEPVVTIKGKSYFATWQLPSQLTYADSTGSGELTYYNETAHNALVNAIKQTYQGQKTMIGTDQEDSTQYSIKTAIDYQKSQNQTQKKGEINE